ncbi:Cold-shock protein [Macleaya cordata]|uniref:Cold-shock protein n=1 Tax=Macleaya cordata TaxID=56857 RepID=A0A200R0G9_MACCD|nr:Cold-shock protein [Macleaya cordata]
MEGTELISALKDRSIAQGSRSTGVVKWFNGQKDFRFITPSDDGEGGRCYSYGGGGSGISGHDGGYGFVSGGGGGYSGVSCCFRGDGGYGPYGYNGGGGGRCGIGKTVEMVVEEGGKVEKKMVAHNI